MIACLPVRVLACLLATRLLEFGLRQTLLFEGQLACSLTHPLVRSVVRSLAWLVVCLIACFVLHVCLLAHVFAS